MKHENTTRVILGRGLLVALALTAATVLLAACSKGEAQRPSGSTSTPSLRATGSPPPTSPTQTPLPRRTPAPTGEDKSPGLIAVYTYVDVDDGTLTLQDTHMAAEEVYFNVNFKGEESHQIVVVRWDGDPGALPVDPASGRVVAASQVVGSLAAQEGGNTEIFEIEPIAPGKYVIFCNEPGHYQRGEYAAFDVVAPR